MKILSGVVFVACFVFAYYHVTEVRRRDARIAQLESRKAQVDTVYQTKVKTLTKVREVTDSVLLVDTLVYRDTIKIYLAAERQACNVVIQTCEQRVAVRDSLIKELKKKPSVWSKAPWVAAGLIGGLLLK